MRQHLNIWVYHLFLILFLGLVYREPKADNKMCGFPYFDAYPYNMSCDVPVGSRGLDGEMPHPPPEGRGARTTVAPQEHRRGAGV